MKNTSKFPKEPPRGEGVFCTAKKVDYFTLMLCRYEYCVYGSDSAGRKKMAVFFLNIWAAPLITVRDGATDDYNFVIAADDVQTR